MTIPNLQSGSLTVRFSACGVVTSSTVTIEGASPTVGAITLDDQPVEGQPFSVFVQSRATQRLVRVVGDWNGNGGVLHHPPRRPSGSASLATPDSSSRRTRPDSATSAW